MTRYVMAADLRRCTGCQTCTSACRHVNATPADVQWRQVLDFEIGTFPNVRRVFVPVGCQHCSDPPCEHVCPTTATKKRADGIVSIDYDLCIGCGYCAVACPYQARHITHKSKAAFGAESIESEVKRSDERRLSVATKCTFCADKVDAGTARGLRPGVDADATPACVNSCIAGALSFGDADDPSSPISDLLAKTEHFRMHEELGTDPGFYYIVDKK